MEKVYEIVRRWPCLRESMQTNLSPSMPLKIAGLTIQNSKHYKI
jgi:hypothetical protein